MNVIDATTGKCPLCTGEKERPLFVVRSAVYNGKICGPHLHGLVRQTREEPAAPENGRPTPTTA
jgi:hypothetical protein